MADETATLAAYVADLTYDAIPREVLERAKSLTPEDLRAALAETNMMTAFGLIKFTSWGQFTNQNKMDTLVLQVIGKKYETVWPKDAASAKYVYHVPRWRERK